MKNIVNFLIVFMLMLMQTSCLKIGLDDLDAYESNDITNVRFEYRWWDSSSNRMRVVDMIVNSSIDVEKKIIRCDIVVPEISTVFTQEIREQVLLSCLAINVDISSAARLEPVGDSPVMGVFPSDFSKLEFLYKIRSATGQEVVWTLVINSFNK